MNVFALIADLTMKTTNTITAAYQAAETHEPIDFIVGSAMARKIERQLIEPHEKPSKMYNQINYGIFQGMDLYEIKTPPSETPTIPLPTSHGTSKNKFLPTVNVKKSEATRLKNRKKRKAKRKNRQQ